VAALRLKKVVTRGDTRFAGGVLSRLSLPCRVMSDGPLVDRARVIHVAGLASLSLSVDEVDKMETELARIVALFEQLGELNTDGVVPTTSLSDGRDPLRPDVVRPGLSHEEALAGAPRALEGGFSVPLFLEGARAER
jgi:aspartyl-tRNA(Asn)/glutamyl-tRNA(Gln) amidotransferase subunit C